MSKKSNTKRKLVGLVSEESGIRAYYTKKNTMNTPDKLSLRKYDPILRKHVVFVETKKNLGRNEVKEKKRQNNFRKSSHLERIFLWYNREDEKGNRPNLGGYRCNS